MRIVIAGATGFLGTPLAAALRADGHDVTALTRRPAVPPPTRALLWAPDGSIGPWAAAIDGADAVVNLAGESMQPLFAPPRLRHRSSSADPRSGTTARTVKNR
jgi:uncharacterized protein YbjT (DUF2867 family)